MAAKNEKRDPDDSELIPYSPESKRLRSEVASNLSLSGGPVSSEDLADRVDSDESVPDSPDTHLIRNDILDILEDPDTLTYNDQAIHDLDSVIKSFQEEILRSLSAPEKEESPVSDIGESQPDLGYLLEASDDELGLPPAISENGRELAEQLSDETTAVASQTAVAFDLMGVEDRPPSHDLFENDGFSSSGNSGGFVAVGGLFQWDEPTDFSEFLWQPESLPAV